MTTAVWIAVPLLTVVAVEDLRYRRIRDRHVLLLAAAVAFAVAVRADAGDDGAVLRALLGSAIATLPLLTAALAQPSRMGGGDVKLAAAVGGLLGVVSPWLSLAAIAGALVVALAATVLRAVPTVPLAPALATATAVALLVAIDA